MAFVGNPRGVTIFIGVILMIMGGLGLIKFAFYGVLILLVLGIIIFTAQYLRSSGGGGFQTFLQRIWSDWRLIFLILVIFFSAILLFLLIFVKGGGFISTLIGLAGDTPGIADDSVWKPFLLLIFGIFLVLFGVGVLHKILGALLLLAGITTGSISGGTSGISNVLQKFGAVNPNYFLFIIALLMGIFLLWKVKGILPKFLGVLLPLFTLPPVATRINEGLITIFIGFFDLYDFFGISWLALVLGILSVLSGFYIFERIIKNPGEFPPNVKVIGFLLASLAILLSFSEIGIIFFDFLNDLILLPVIDFFNNLTSFAPEIGDVFGPGFYFVTGILLVFSGEQLKGAANLGYTKARDYVRRIPRGPGPGPGFTPGAAPPGAGP